MGYSKIKEIFNYAGIVGAGIVIGAVFTGVAVRLPMLVEAKWARETSHIKFDSRTVYWCEAKETDSEEVIDQ